MRDWQLTAARVKDGKIIYKKKNVKKSNFLVQIVESFLEERGSGVSSVITVLRNNTKIKERFIWTVFVGKRISLCAMEINWNRLFVEHLVAAPDPLRFNLAQI